LRLSRRTLLVAAGAGAGLALAYAAWPRGERASLRTGRDALLLGPGMLIRPDGAVTVAVPQVETGQGIWTGLAQVAADELGAAWERVAVAPALPGSHWPNALAEEEGWLLSLGPLDRPGFDEELTRITAGSTSVRAMEEPMRRIGAAARALLVAEAADHWGVAAGECDTARHFVLHEGKRIGFGELAEGAAARSLPADPPLRTSPGALLGQPLPRLDAAPKAKGSLRFAGDVRLPNMLFASVRRSGGGRAEVRSPAPPGIRFSSGREWVAAVGPNWWAAEQALSEAEVATFGPAGGDDRAVDLALEAALAGGETELLHNLDDVDAAFEGVRPLAATYEAAALLHPDLEPPAATARMQNGRLELWLATQAPEAARARAADLAGLGPERVTLYQMPVGGQGGRAIESELADVAVALARETGRPVQVVMSRTEQVRSDPVRSPLRCRLFARQLPDGTLSAWRMRLAGGDGTAEAMRRLWGGEGRSSFRPAAVPPLAYAIPNLAVEAVTAELPLRLGYHRGELAAPLTFFVESFLDELARIGGRDPLAMRMAMLGSNPRLARCLARATALGGWDGGGPGSQMGLAALSAFGSHIALVASASRGPTGAPEVSRMVAVVDCGRAVNPLLVQQQVEGGLLSGLAAASTPAPSFRHGRVLRPEEPPAGRLAGSPEILVEVLPSRERPGGVNGLGVAVAPAAVGNALAAATGRRLRTLPFDPMS
jgi:isoquinoline 1-oxidoreductase subunit beta